MRITTGRSFAASATLAAILASSSLSSQSHASSSLVDSAPEPGAEAVVANNAFTGALFAALAEEHEGNVIASPMSVSTVFAMLAEGARGQTAEQIVDVFGYPLTDSATGGPAVDHAAVAAMLASLTPRDEDNTLTVANALWGQELEFPFDEGYLSAVRDAYGAGLTACDFAGQPDTERERINAWVAEQTNGRIEDLLPEGSVDGLTRLVLTNAVYFLGSWSTPFDADRTTDEAFHLAGGESVDVPTMHGKARFGYAQADGVVAVELPFEGDELTMVFVLPGEGAGLDAVVSDVDGLLSAMRFSRRGEVELALPRFELRTGFDLSGTLRGMGMPEAFGDAADLSGIGGSPGDLSVTGVFHQAFVKVDESGAEAAAATGVVVGTRSLPPPPVAVVFDRPFVFAIRHAETGALLFVGRVMDPRG